MGRGGSKKGRPKPKGSGRKAGAKNKVTLACKEAIEYAFAGLGGQDALLAWAKAEPSLFFTHIWSKLLPRPVEVTGKNGKPIQFEQVEAMSDDELRRGLNAAYLDPSVQAFIGSGQIQNGNGETH